LILKLELLLNCDSDADIHSGDTMSDDVTRYVRPLLPLAAAAVAPQPAAARATCS
jgi:hypothetical protein